MTLRRVLLRLGLGILLLAGMVMLVAVLAYSFGGMERPAPGTRAAFEALVAAGRAEPLPRRLTIPIPGCRCHSQDPVLTMQHSVYRIRECRSCHESGGTSAGRP